MSQSLTADAYEHIRKIRREIHSNPELGFQEHRTAELVADELRRAGVDEVHEGIGGTGVVGVIRRGASSRSIGIRADMDALPVIELGTLPHASRCSGVMHACGHDGHTAMLLGAAYEIARRTVFDGTVYLVFQPAEEGLGGARRMIDDGRLFERFAMDGVYALHNWPGLPLGHLAIKPGAMMGAVDRFDIEIEGRGAHAAQPHTGTDPVVIAAELVGMLQAIVSRYCAPTDFAVVSVTEMTAGSAYNVIPESARLRGTVRSVDPVVRERIEGLIGRMTKGLMQCHGASCSIAYVHGTPPTINHNAETAILRKAAVATVGPDQVEDIAYSSLAGEDFSCFLERCPGAFIRLGNGMSADLHNPHYDFDDRAIPIGVELWRNLVEATLTPAR